MMQVHQMKAVAVELLGVNASRWLGTDACPQRVDG
jgi:hypothetical protein